MQSNCPNNTPLAFESGQELTFVSAYSSSKSWMLTHLCCLHTVSEVLAVNSYRIQTLCVT